MSYKPKRIYVEQMGDHFRTAERLSELALKGKAVAVSVYELVDSGTLRCEPTLHLKSGRFLDETMPIGGTD